MTRYQPSAPRQLTFAFLWELVPVPPRRRLRRGDLRRQIGVWRDDEWRGEVVVRSQYLCEVEVGHA